MVACISHPLRRKGRRLRQRFPALAALEVSAVMKVWTNGEEAYVAPSAQAVADYHRTEYGLPEGDFSPVEDWKEQTGNITITFETADIDDDMRANAVKIELGRSEGTTRITKTSEQWASERIEVGLLWSSNF